MLVTLAGLKQVHPAVSKPKRKIKSKELHNEIYIKICFDNYNMKR